MGGGGMDMGGGGATMAPLGGGMGESMKKPQKTTLAQRDALFEENRRLHEDIKSSDIVAPDSKTGTGSGKVVMGTPNDRSIMANDPLKDDASRVKLEVIRKIRLSHMARRIENEKRRKIVAQIYAPPPRDDGMGGGPF